MVYTLKVTTTTICNPEFSATCAEMSKDFDGMYPTMGRPSIAPERLDRCCCRSSIPFRMNACGWRDSVATVVPVVCGLRDRLGGMEWTRFSERTTAVSCQGEGNAQELMSDEDFTLYPDARLYKNFARHLASIERPNQFVTAMGTANSVAWGPVNEGHTDGSGNFTITGTFAVASIGTYTEKWYVAGGQVGPTLSFPVSPVSSAQIANITHPGWSLTVGDAWKVTITGPLNGPVSVSGTTNGVPWGPSNVGQTDAGGTFSTTGVMGSGSAGSYTETWYVAGVPVGTVFFTVSAVQTVQMFNITRPGNPNFVVGDTWKVTLTGAPNQPVTAAGTANGVAWGPVNEGQSDGGGNFSATGVFGGASIGNYTETWYIAGGQVGPTLSFKVNAVPTAQIANLLHPGWGLAVGDSWKVTVTGPPNQPVTLSGITNGAPWGPSNQGQTDAGGNFSSTGTLPAGSAGVYLEIWYASGIPANPTLAFTISPSVQLTNVTHPGWNFTVGDIWRIVVSGGANQAVLVSGTGTGGAWGPVAMGQTDGGGSFTATGTMTPGSFGTYTETWSVGGILVVCGKQINYYPEPRGLA
jgi:hypothetical protein